ncbi:uncharacterized protein N7459_007633 [Penicillium hispanicum]|uniref:uncharacterized protein n=1 Tax=Penicillium hispanicum TaxID=1080232 RepID=UPI002540D3B3|nr:uncharacterized protein N7459_007633 [Penicillium hispanicum]KAJ5578669.1 hypothetical protein N7459_007633 [Penicillium hispanicum]
MTYLSVRAHSPSAFDRLLEPQTIPHFIEFACGSPLPDGTRPDVNTLTEDEIDFLEGNFPPDSDGQSIITRVMTRIGSEEDNGRLCIVGKNIHSLKSRLWEGITPLGDQRWEENGLHLSGNFESAFQHISAVLAVFEYLNAPQAREDLRTTFNLIYDHWETLDTLLNRRRTRMGAHPISVANLWTMYMAAQFKVMTQRAHEWVTRHVDALRAPVLQELLDHQSLNEGTGKPDQMQWKLTNALHILLEISVRADYTIMIPMEGYKGYMAPENGSGPPEMYVADVNERGKVYAHRLKTLSHQTMFKKILNGVTSGGTPSQTSGQSYHESAMEQIEAQIQVRRELRGDSVDTSLPEPWITRALSAEEDTSPDDRGLAIYRLTYGQSEEEWSEFVKKLEAHVFDWGKGQTGTDAIKRYLKLHWVDGKELGFAEDDIEAAKKSASIHRHVLTRGLKANHQSRHFNQTVDNDDNNKNDGSTMPLRLQPNAFLVVDAASFESYTAETYAAATPGLLPGDFTGFILAIDPSFDPAEGISRPDESPNYSGQMRILGSLVWGDLYALLESQSAGLEDLWPLAMHHPNQVYVGPTIPLQVSIWRPRGWALWSILRFVMQCITWMMGW